MKQKVVVKTRKAKQKLWCHGSEQETGSSGQDSLPRKLHPTQWNGWDGSSGPTTAWRNTLYKIQLPDSQVTFPTTNWG